MEYAFQVLYEITCNPGHFTRLCEQLIATLNSWPTLDEGFLQILIDEIVGQVWVYTGSSDDAESHVILMHIHIQSYPRPFVNQTSVTMEHVFAMQSPANCRSPTRRAAIFGQLC